MKTYRKAWGLAAMVVVPSLAAVVLIGGCSLDVPKHTGGVTIKVEDANGPAPAALLTDQLQELLSGPRILATTGPTGLADFGCFAVNVTGVGVQSQSQRLQNCTTPTNMHGVGIGLITDLFPKGSSVTVGVPGGVPLNVDVYGVFPPDPVHCPTAPGANTGGGGGSGGGGFFLGRVNQVLAADTTVTVPVAYAGGGPDVMCSGGGGGGFFVGMVFPYGGSIAGNWTVNINGSGFSAGTTASIGTVACATTTFVNPNLVQCVVPASGIGTGSYTVTVKDLLGHTAVTPSAFFQLQSSALPFVSVDNNTNNVDFGSVTVGSTKDITITFANAGGVATGSAMSAPALAAPFTYKGGTFPGTGGTCSAATLAGLTANVPGSCTIVVTFSPTTTGLTSINNAGAGFTYFVSGSVIISKFSGTGI